MCGIVGLFSKSTATEQCLGSHLAAMLAQLSERGPDSAGIAVYREETSEEACKAVLFAGVADYRWEQLAEELEQELGRTAVPRRRANHALMSVEADANELSAWLRRRHPELRVVSVGRSIEIYKDKGPPDEFVKRFAVDELAGTHAIGHTRMATESRVSTEHSHPFTTGLDLCLVHNGSLSNHNRLRQLLKRRGIEFQTDNDSEVAAGYLTWRLSEGATLDEALESALADLDGFFTFAVASTDGFAVLRDPIACKPAVLAETDEWVAMASEYRAIAVLPGASDAEIWEPEPARIYSWQRALVA